MSLRSDNEREQQGIGGGPIQSGASRQRDPRPRTKAALQPGAKAPRPIVLAEDYLHAEEGVRQLKGGERKTGEASGLQVDTGSGGDQNSGVKFRWTPKLAPNSPMA